MIRILILLCTTLAGGACAQAQTPMALRETAMKVLEAKAGIERVASNCRWIRGIEIRPRARAWLDDNLDFIDAAARLIESQGGLTPDRKALAEELGAHAMQNHSISRESCEAFGKALANGELDLPRTMRTAVLRELGSVKSEPPSEVIWVVELRRGKNGSLYRETRRYGLDDGIEACDRNAAAKGHIWTRRNTAADGSPLPGIDMESWMQECVASDRNPVEPEVATAGKSG